MSISEKAAVLAERYDKVLYQRKRDEIMEELKALEGGDEKGGHSDHLSKNRDSLGEEYGLSGSSVARLLRVNQLIPEIKELREQGNMQLMAAVQLSYLPEQAQKLAMEASKKSGVAINKDIAAKVRKAPMTEKTILEAIAGKQPEVDPVHGVVEKSLRRSQSNCLQVSEKSIFRIQIRKKWKRLSIRRWLPGLRRNDEEACMFDSEQLKQVDPAYFNIILADDMDVTIQSRNTGHYWYLHCTGYPTEGSCMIFHKHRFSHPYHQHGRENSLRQAIRSIQKADERKKIGVL